MLKIKGAIVIPVEVQKHFSAAKKGRLLLSATLANGSEAGIFFGLKVLCDPGTSDVVVPVDIHRTGCASEMRLVAQVTEISQADQPCGTNAHGPGMANREVVVAEAAQPIFVGHTNCSDDTALIQMTTVPLPAL